MRKPTIDDDDPVQCAAILLLANLGDDDDGRWRQLYSAAMVEALRAAGGVVETDAGTMVKRAVLHDVQARVLEVMRQQLERLFEGTPDEANARVEIDRRCQRLAQKLSAQLAPVRH